MRLPRIALAMALAAPLVGVAWGATASEVQSSPLAEIPAGVNRIGTEQATATSLRYADGARQELRYPGATYIKVHFDALRLAPGDYVTVADRAGRETYTYHGDPTRATAKASGDSGFTVHRTSGFAAMSVEGDTAVVTLHTVRARPKAATRAYAVRIDRFWRGYSESELAANNIAPLSVCGADARRDRVCYRTSRPTEFARSAAVARLIIGGGGLCTAWRVGSTNRVLTNNHCISTAAAVRASEVQFGFECRTCGGNNPGPGTKVSGAQFFRTSTRLDYTLFSVANFASIAPFGTLFLDVRAPVRNERIYIPGHGDGRPMRISIFTATQGGATCKIDSPNSDSTNTGYFCDTSGGNSGSPVIAASSNRVIALHHLGGCLNEGTRIQLIFPEIASLIVNS
jgi:lysyl endopeptidase